jgi:serine/threonine-protein kinase
MKAVEAAATLESSTMDLRRLAVLYFQDASADGSLAPVADGLTDGLIRALSQVRELDVVSRNGSEQVRNLAVSTDSIASILQAGILVLGSVAPSGEDLKVTVRLVDGQSGTEIQRHEYNSPSASLNAVGDELAQEVSNSLRVLLGQEIRLREGRSRAPSTPAWLQLARGEKALREASAALRSGQAEAAAGSFALADRELLGAVAMDARWTAPVVLRARVAYERFGLAGTVDEAFATLDSAVALTDQALALEPDNAEALEVRGTARYRRWLLPPGDASEAEREQLLQSAKEDLERAKSLDRTVAANVNSVLSHLYYQVSNWPEAVLAAREAYEDDAFLAAADGVLWRLYLASYDLGQYQEARRWCLEGNRRFPGNYRFVQCQIVIMTMPDGEPDITQAWTLFAQIEPLLPEGQKELLSGVIRTFIGGVVGRAGLADSAQAVFEAARLPSGVDPGAEQLSMEAAMRSVIGDVDGALEALQLHMLAAPGSFPGEHWWWRNIQTTQEFQRLRTVR